MNAAGTEEKLLVVDGIHVGYGSKPVVNGATFHVRRGEILALLGPNGAGKSTVLKAVFGLLRVWHGSVRLNGEPIQNRSPIENLKAGLGFVPQGGRVYPELSILENLELAGSVLSSDGVVRDRVRQTLDEYPLLSNRRSELAGNLSSGQRQLLAFARILVTKPQLILLDEPSVGLAPQVVRDMMDRLHDLNTRSGVTLLIVEQNVREAMRISQRIYVLRQGRVVLNCAPQVDLGELRRAFLG
jgi:branched-chain amino acid transport system ATP-binding protein